MPTMSRPPCPTPRREPAGTARPRHPAAAVWLLALAFAGCRPGANAPAPGDLGAAPDFTLITLEREAVTLSSLRGKIVLLDFWASWCPPCRASLPHIESIHRDYREKGLAVYGINDEDPGLARSFVQTNRYSFPTLSDTDGVAARTFGVTALPTTILIDADGVVRYRFVGLTAEPQMRDALRQLGL